MNLDRLQIVLPWPDSKLMPNRKNGKVVWTEELIERALELYRTRERKEVAMTLGISDSALRAKLSRLGVTLKAPLWTKREERLLRDRYLAADFSEQIGLDQIARELGRHKSNVCRKARQLGLTDPSKKRVANPKIRKPRFQNPEDRGAHRSALVKERWASKGHPKGMLGKHHSAETKRLLSESASRWNASVSDGMRAEYVLKANKTRAKNGTLYPQRSKTTWRAGWREVGGQRKYYRSRWEANYARYLEWLKGHARILEWEHEPKTFWFDGVRRGTNSYLPDFRVVNLDGSEEYHEVKGWMDARSKTKIRRMAKYHPTVRLVVIDGSEYSAIRNAVAGMIDGWEE